VTENFRCRPEPILMPEVRLRGNIMGQLVVQIRRARVRRIGRDGRWEVAAFSEWQDARASDSREVAEVFDVLNVSDVKSS